MRYSTTGDTLASVCDSFAWYGTLYTATTNSPTRLSTNAANCDSTTTLHLTIRHSTTGDTTANVCDSLTWYGTTYSTSTNTPIHHSTNAVNCDSTTTLHLTVRYSSTGDTMANECDQFTWWNTNFTNDTNSAIHVSTNAVGCDSTVTLHLTLRHSTYSTYYDTIIENNLPATFNGHTYPADTANAPVIIPNAVLCDSNISYNLHVHRNVLTVLDSSICNDTLPIVWNGVTFDTLVIASSTLTRAVTYLAHTGADSVVRMHLTVHPLYDHHLHTETCDNRPFPFGDSAYAIAGNYTDHLHSIHGCDSFSSLHLTVHPTFFYYGVDTICHGDTMHWRGYVIQGQNPDLTESFYLNDSLLTVHRCDSVEAVHITKMAVPHITFQLDTNCAIPGYNLSVISRAPLTDSTEPRPMPYIRWSSIPSESLPAGSEHDSALVLSPYIMAQYLFYTDYHESPLCPATESITLEQIIAPKAEISINPPVLTQDNLHFVAVDRSRSRHTARAWYIDGLQQDFTGQILEDDADIHADSLRVDLEIYNGHCYDTVGQTLIIYHVEVSAPNVFTPLRSENNRFRLTTLGVLDGELFIYDRIGDLVFYTPDITESWDGTYRGEMCTQRAYVWVFRYHAIDKPGALQQKTGTVTLLR